MTAASKEGSGKRQKVENIRPTNPSNRIRNEEPTLAGIHCRFHATNPRSRHSHQGKADVRASTSRHTDFKSYPLRRRCRTLRLKVNQQRCLPTRRDVNWRQVPPNKLERVRSSQQRSRQTRNCHEAIQPSAAVFACCGHVVFSGHTY